jgi:hypothetical protein
MFDVLEFSSLKKKISKKYQSNVGISRFFFSMGFFWGGGSRKVIFKSFKAIFTDRPRTFLINEYKKILKILGINIWHISCLSRILNFFSENLEEGLDAWRPPCGFPYTVTDSR